MGQTGCHDGKGPERGIASEELVAAEPREGCLYPAFVGGLASVEGVYSVARGLVARRDESFNVGRHLASGQYPRVVHGTEMARGRFRIIGLRESVLLEPD